MTSKQRTTASKKASRRKEASLARLNELIAEATVDAYDDSEQVTGFYTMFEEHLAFR